MVSKIPQHVCYLITFLKDVNAFSSYLEILRGAPQGSILGPILFNISINDLIFFIQEAEVCNFADDTTIYSCSLNYKEAAHKLSNDTHIVLNWFKVNIADLWGEWPSGLRRCNQNRKVPRSNPTMCLARLRDPTSLRGSR